MKTISFVGLMAVAAMNLMACIPGALGCDADDPEVSPRVAPLQFEPTTTTVSCDANGDVKLDLSSAQGSTVRMTVQPDVRLVDSLPLTAAMAPSGNSVTSSTSDDTVKVTLTDVEYNELPSGWQNAAVVINSVPARRAEALDGKVSFYFADGRTLDVSFNARLTANCGASPIN